MQDQEGERPEREQQRGPCRRLESGRLRKEEEEQRQDAVRVVQAAVGQLSECVCVCVSVSERVSWVMGLRDRKGNPSRGCGQGPGAGFGRCLRPKCLGNSQARTGLGSEGRPGVENRCDGPGHWGNSQGHPRGRRAQEVGKKRRGWDRALRSPHLTSQRQVPVGRSGGQERQGAQRQRRGRELGVQGVLKRRPSEKQRKGGLDTGGPIKFRLLSLLPRGTEDRGAAPISRSHQRNTHTVTEEAKKEEMQRPGTLAEPQLSTAKCARTLISNITDPEDALQQNVEGG